MHNYIKRPFWVCSMVIAIISASRIFESFENCVRYYFLQSFLTIYVSKCFRHFLDYTKTHIILCCFDDSKILVHLKKWE